MTADRTKAIGVALAGRQDEDEVEVEELEVTTARAAAILGFHPEHVRRLIRSGRLRARRVGGDFWVRLNDLWPLSRCGTASRGGGGCAFAAKGPGWAVAEVSL